LSKPGIGIKLSVVYATATWAVESEAVVVQDGVTTTGDALQVLRFDPTLATMRSSSSAYVQACELCAGPEETYSAEMRAALSVEIKACA
jgi:hypothetical protein